MTSGNDDAWCRCLVGVRVGKYLLDRFVGAGKIGYVYQAHNVDIPELTRAVKLSFDLKPGWEVELKKVAKLDLIEGVVHFHELGSVIISQSGKSHLAQFTVWDYIPPGESLKGYLRRVRQVPTTFLIAVVERVLHVLHACENVDVHRHGDLHSGNVLIGKSSTAKLDDSLQPRAPIYVSDFGYGVSGAVKEPKDDYEGLARIINEIIDHIEYSQATPADRQILRATKERFGKFVYERVGSERRPPLELLQLISGIKGTGQYNGISAVRAGFAAEPDSAPHAPGDLPNVGNFQVSEMIGDRWDVWKRLFVPTVPTRSKILALDIPSVVTGPRGCGKTMFFRRLSERLVLECGEVTDLPNGAQFVALYINANDFADAFARFPEKPRVEDEERLICFANLCVFAELLTVQSARAAKPDGRPTDDLLANVRNWLDPNETLTLIEGEDRLRRYRTILEQVKWTFPSKRDRAGFPGYADLSQYRWLPRFFQQARAFCPWIGNRSVLLFIDDYSTPRVSPSMQRILNRLFLQRSPYFLAKMATEASTTFVSEDSSGKSLEDGDDYQLIDMGEESLFLPEQERRLFLNSVFSRRLESDSRIPNGKNSLQDLLGLSRLSKTEFAKRLRTPPATQSPEQRIAVVGGDQRRGQSRARVLYMGEDVFTDLWSGDTRTMIQLITDIVSQASEGSQGAGQPGQIAVPVDGSLQDRVFRNRGGAWLSSHSRDEPTDRDSVEAGILTIRKSEPGYQLCGEYGDHLKAITEAFVAAARRLLLGPAYEIREGENMRQVPRMAFRIEIVDEFRIDGLAREIYRDLVRYGLFIRDSRGKSVRGAFVPRLFLRRLILPYSSLALSKRDSLMLTCSEFTRLLLKPDEFKATYKDFPERGMPAGMQLSLFPVAAPRNAEDDSVYDDLESNDNAIRYVDTGDDEDMANEVKR